MLREVVEDQEEDLEADCSGLKRRPATSNISTLQVDFNGLEDALKDEPTCAKLIVEHKLTVVDSKSRLHEGDLRGIEVPVYFRLGRFGARAL